MKLHQSRRLFLKYLSAAPFIPFLAHTNFHALIDWKNSTTPIVRTTRSGVGLFSSSSTNSELIRRMEKDVILPVTGFSTGDPNFCGNKLWYELNNEGYAHAESLQTVSIKLNQVINEIPADGILMELTVPYSDAKTKPLLSASTLYRLYFGSVFWVEDVLMENDSLFWYKVYDDAYYRFYIRAEHLRPVTAAEISPISTHIPESKKLIKVNLSAQQMTAYEYNEPVFQSRLSSGTKFGNDDFSTPPGQFITNRKRPTRHMRDIIDETYDLPGVPWVSYITGNGIAFHGTYWHNDFGWPRSHGCLNLPNHAAKWVYRWTTPFVPYSTRSLQVDSGTKVIIEKS